MSNWDIVYALKYSFANKKLRADFEQEQEEAYQIKEIVAKHLSPSSRLTGNSEIKVINGGSYKKEPQLDLLSFDNNKISGLTLKPKYKVKAVKVINPGSSTSSFGNLTLDLLSSTQATFSADIKLISISVTNPGKRYLSSSAIIKIDGVDAGTVSLIPDAVNPGFHKVDSVTLTNVNFTSAANITMDINPSPPSASNKAAFTANFGNDLTITNNGSGITNFPKTTDLRKSDGTSLPNDYEVEFDVEIDSVILDKSSTDAKFLISPSIAAVRSIGDLATATAEMVTLLEVSNNTKVFTTLVEINDFIQKPSNGQKSLMLKIINSLIDDSDWIDQTKKITEEDFNSLTFITDDSKSLIEYFKNVVKLLVTKIWEKSNKYKSDQLAHLQYANTNMGILNNDDLKIYGIYANNFLKKTDPHYGIDDYKNVINTAYVLKLADELSAVELQVENQLQGLSTFFAYKFVTSNYVPRTVNESLGAVNSKEFTDLMLEALSCIAIKKAMVNFYDCGKPNITSNETYEFRVMFDSMQLQVPSLNHNLISNSRFLHVKVPVLGLYSKYKNANGDILIKNIRSTSGEFYFIVQIDLLWIESNMFIHFNLPKPSIDIIKESFILPTDFPQEIKVLFIQSIESYLTQQLNPSPYLINNSSRLINKYSYTPIINLLMVTDTIARKKYFPTETEDYKWMLPTAITLQTLLHRKYEDRDAELLICCKVLGESSPSFPNFSEVFIENDEEVACIAISRYIFLSKILLPSIVKLFKNASNLDFILESGVITNVVGVFFNSDTALSEIAKQISNQEISAKNLQVEIVERRIRMTIKNLQYSKGDVSKEFDKEIWFTFNTKDSITGFIIEDDVTKESIKALESDEKWSIIAGIVTGFTFIVCVALKRFYIKRRSMFYNELNDRGRIVHNIRINQVAPRELSAVRINNRLLNNNINFNVQSTERITAFMHDILNKATNQVLTIGQEMSGKKRDFIYTLNTVERVDGNRVRAHVSKLNPNTDAIHDLYFHALFNSNNVFLRDFKRTNLNGQPRIFKEAFINERSVMETFRDYLLKEYHKKHGWKSTLGFMVPILGFTWTAWEYYQKYLSEEKLKQIKETASQNSLKALLDGVMKNFNLPRDLSLTINDVKINDFLCITMKQATEYSSNTIKDIPSLVGLLIDTKKLKSIAITNKGDYEIKAQFVEYIPGQQGYNFYGNEIKIGKKSGNKDFDKQAWGLDTVSRYYQILVSTDTVNDIVPFTINFKY
jgi:hypothetical protein